MASNHDQSNTEKNNSEIRKAIFSFKRTHEAEVSNSKILVAFKGDLGAAITAHKDIPVNYGSEFRDTTALEKLFLYHEDKTKIVDIIKQGYRYHLDPIKEETIKLDLNAMILRETMNNTNQ